MYYRVQQSCLFAAIVLVNVIGTDWFKAWPYWVRCVSVLLFGASAITGIVMASLAERRRIKKS